MKLHYRILLFLPVSILLGALCFFVFKTRGTSPNYAHYYALSGVDDVRDRIEFRLEMIREFTELKVSPETIDLWLQHKLPKTDPAEKGLLDPPKLDIWGNPYRLRIEPGSTVDELFVYSTGEDGVSHSNGNDPDDIRQWDENKGDWYLNRILFRERIVCLMFGAALSPFFLVFFLAVTRPRKVNA